MLVPEPPVTLEGHCSVIHNNSLYTLSTNGFASIPLELNGTWSELSTDGAELVSNAACVTGGVDGNEDQQALYVVGGSSSNSDAPGLQRYTFKDGKWKTLPIQVDPLANRTGHAAVYLSAISKLLIFGGTTEGATEGSSDTFTVTTKPNYILDSESGANASPAESPNLLTWSTDKAVMFGGAKDPSAVYFWDSEQGWHTDGYNDTDISYPTGVKTALFSQDNGKYRLRTFDTTASPVTVGTYELTPNPSDVPQTRKRKRDDDSFAPTSVEKGSSFAQSTSGDQLVVLSGGSGTDTLSIFNQSATDGSGWVNATKLFYGDQSEQDILGSTPSSSATPSSTPSASPSGLPTSSGDSDDDNIGVILGAVLGSLAGVAVILVLILFYIKRKKEKMRQAAGADKDRLSFQDQGVEPLTRSAYPMAQSPAPKAASSVDSLAIFSGNMGDEKSPKAAGALPQHMQKSQPARPSPLNNIQSSDSKDWDGDSISSMGSPIRPGDRTTDEGWGKYFQDNHTTPTLVGIQSPFADSARGSKATIWPGENNDNALPPLQTSFLAEPTPLGRVNSGSPTTEFATSVRDGRQIAIPQSQSARISSASAETASINDDDDDDDRYRNARERSWLGRPPSSAYSRSFYNPGSSTRDVTSTAAPSTIDWRKHDSARTNTRGSSILIPEGQPLPRNNVNSDMSWLNLNADR
ncbi:uncharacterized protein BDV14DRAFT_117582 [Aspergillus stella-maris]|uniref:uncharacterized protein n=1 Tax=Aspergillus stella-maris TaxID=1810926 RepID=UPI003CCCAFF4